MRPHISRGTISTWRLQSRAVVAAALGALPPDADPGARRRAVSAAYPFGRRRGWPHLCWLDEVRLALRVTAAADDGRPDVAWMLDWGAGKRPVAYPWLDVRCGWCAGTALGGCMACHGDARLLAALVGRPQWAALRAAAGAGDAAARMALIDWLQEQGAPAPYEEGVPP